MIAALALLAGAAVLLRGSSPASPQAPVSHVRVTTAVPAAKSELETLLEQWVSDDPLGGFFYQIQPDDLPLDIAFAVLGEEAGIQNAIDYLRCISSGPSWNMPLYATPSTSNRIYPDSYMVPGKKLGVRVAFLPRNQDALDVMLTHKRMPQMAVDPRTGAPSGEGESYGLLWLPPVDENFSCGSFSWEDGSSTIDPPPRLLELLT